MLPNVVCTLRRGGLFWLILLVLISKTWAANLTLKDGRVLEGRVGQVVNLTADPLKPNGAEDSGNAPEIIVVDDDLRRTFICHRMVTAVDEQNLSGGKSLRVKVPQRVASAGSRIASVGAFLQVSPFDGFGRRTVTMATDRGPVTVIQGITEITPIWTKIEGLQTTQSKPFIWDMRIATSSIPRADLSAILENVQKQVTPKDPEAYRANIVRLFMFGGRYHEAEQELQALLKVAKTPQDYAEFAKQLKGLSSNLVLQELEQRSKAGQHQFAATLLKAFAEQKPDPNLPIPGEIMQKVGEMLRTYDEEHERGVKIVEQLDKQMGLLSDSPVRFRFEPAIKQIKDELNHNTLDRLKSFYRLSDAENLKPEQKLALAISGWVLGADDANEDATIALSALEIRELMRKYLREPNELKRTDLAKQLNSQPGFTAKITAQIADFMKAPLDPPEKLAAPGNIAGYYELSIPSAVDKEATVTYQVQLPPEYDPYRRYPTIVTLHGSGTTPGQQIEWWAGAPVPQGENLQSRLGQATRQGYIVIAPSWTTRPKQNSYDASAAEHYAVLGSLRDACRHFAIDTDRVYLTGHSLGASAAWDIGVAHPDLWAGVIPIVGVQDEHAFPALYPLNAKFVSTYFVFGELDGDKLVRSAINLDRYLTGSNYDATVVEYRGRGHEDFSDEIQRLFDWMGRKKRNFFPKDFQCQTMRSWDNYFWWLEINQFPAGITCQPQNGGVPPKARPMAVSGRYNTDKDGGSSNLWISAGSSKVTVWISPEMVDLTKPVTVNFNGKTTRAPSPRGETVLEDIRTRGDRRHPFWVRVE